MHERTLDLKTSVGQSVSISYLENPSCEKIAVIFPGANYSCDRPLLYYSADILVRAGYNVAMVGLLLGQRKDWRELSASEQLTIAQHSALEIFDELLRRLSIQEIRLVGKSLGSHGISHIAKERPQAPISALALLTPISESSLAIAQAHASPSLIVIGDEDPRYERLSSSLPPETLIIPGADHSLERDTMPQTLDALRLYLDHFSHWLSP